MKHLFYFVLVFLFCFSTTSFSQNPEWIVYKELSVSCITIDDYGNIWFGSNGLLKFDGDEFHPYNASNSDLPSTFFTCIDIDDDGTIWLGTSNDGLVEFDGISASTYTTSNSDLPSNSILDLAIDSHGNKWIATKVNYTHQGDGLIKLDYLTWEITVYDTLNSEIPGNNVYCIEIDEYDNVWVGTCIYGYAPWNGKGMAKFDGTNWTVYNEHNSGLPNNTVVDIAIDKSGDKWILSSSGLTKFDDSIWTSNKLLGEDYMAVSCLVIDKSGTKFIGTGAHTNANSGMLRFDDTDWSQYVTDNSDIPSSNVYCIAVDKFDNKWIGTAGHSGGISALAVFNENGVVTDVKKNIQYKYIPKIFELHQNYPNPFNPSTKIKYQIPSNVKSETANVKLIVYDILGRVLATLVNQQQKPGYYEVQFTSNNVQLTSGVYFYKINAGSFVETKKMILLR